MYKQLLYVEALVLRQQLERLEQINQEQTRNKLIH